ncbi:TolC family protein [Spirosoma sp. KNUC1025]|uniref:TolC family protein n=1 Tax=Spirosoma sp. KNUC1025 TaxID=2894082 RepID=UPI00386AFC7A|nr:TolC family protein [Spirosoma sp. KNUC1025]
MKQYSINSLIRPAKLLLLSLAVMAGLQTMSYGQGATPPQTSAAKPAVTQGATSVLDSMTFDFNRDISIQLIPFEEIFQIALKYSSVVKFEGSIASAQQAAYSLSKLQILQNVGAYYNYSTGNQAIVSTGLNAADKLGQISNGYRTGVNVAISLHDLFGRSQQIRLARSNYESAMERRRTSEIGLKRELFNLYQDLNLSQRILQIRLRDEQVALTAYRIAEVELQKGKITPEAHAFNSSRYANTQSSVEEAKSQFIKNIYALELLVGVPIYQLKRN